MMRFSGSSAAFGGLMLLSLATASSAAGVYTLIDLGTLGGSTSFGRDVNDSRQLTGNSQTPAGQSAPRLNAFLSQGSGAMANLGVLPGSNNFSRGYAINRHGVIVGDSDNNRARPFVYSGGSMSQLASLAGANSPGGAAHGINDAGTIVGASSNGSTSRPTIWQAGTPADLGSLDGLTSSPGRAWGINNIGAAVGVSRRDAGSTIAQATLWNGMIGPLNLGSLRADSFSEAFAINDAGIAVGAAVDGETQFGTSIRRAVRWVPGTSGYSIEQIGSLGLTFSEAKDINNSGQIVGLATNISGLAQRAFLWENGSMLDLNSLIDPVLGWTLTSAEGINGNGDIVGFGTFGGSTRAYLLTTVIPVPGSLILMLSGMLAIVAVRLRRRQAQ